MISIKTQLGKIFDPGRVQKVAREEFTRAMTIAVSHTEGKVKEKTPVGVTGILRAGVTGKVVSPVRGVVGVSGPASKYAETVEHGRRPNKRFPPPDAIELWLLRTDKGKAFVSAIKEKYNIKKQDTALKSATFLKSRAIAKRGIRAVKMFKKTEKQEKKRILNFFVSAANRIEARLSG